MADLKISQLTDATTPLAGTEVLPIVQSSSTKKVAISALTAGRAVSGTSFTVTGSSIPTNGIYLSAANTFSIATNSVEQLRVDSSGRLIVKSATAYGSAATFTGTQATVVINYTSSTSYGGLRIYNDQNSSGRALEIDYSGSAYSGAFLTGGPSGEQAAITTTGAYPLVLGSSNTARMIITSAGLVQVTSGNSIQVGGSAARATTAGTNRVDIFNGTAPVGTLANGISLYSSSGEAYVMDAAGNATLFSPHDRETNEWIFRSKHTPTGKVLKIDVEKLLRFVNDHFGLGAVQEFIEE